MCTLLFLGCLQALDDALRQDSGVRVPDNISVVGFDGSREAQNAKPKLTTVAQDNLLRAKTAIGLLMKMIGGDTEAKTVCIPVKLTLGESVRRLTNEL